ncbi:aspartyl-tRNA synthetase [Trypanosoma cruzi cruzi]|nr:aspartyl-tRNA synthetase [Trypanosoma cruzi cruzi]
MRRQRWVLQRHCSGSFTATAVGRATIRQGISLSSLTSLEAAAAKPATRIRGRLETTRIRGKIAFIHLRQPPCHSIQVVASAADIVRRVKELTPESIIDATGTLVPAERPVTSASCKNYELHAERVDVVSRAATPLPFPIKDCNTRLDTRLNHRVMDMRTPLTASVLRLVSAHVRACLCLCSRTAGPMDHGKTNKRAASHRTHGMNERMHFCDGVFLPPLVVVFSLARVFSPSPPIRQRPPRAHVEGHIRVHIYLSVSVYIYRGNKDSVGGKLIRRSLVSRNERTTCLQFGTGGVGRRSLS